MSSLYQNQSEQNNYKTYAIIGLCCQFILLVGALAYYKERMLFSDAPHVLFRIINEHKLQIAERRYGSFITQLFPLLGERCHLPLQILSICYSASFNIFFLSVSLLMTYKYNRYDLTLLLTFYLTLFVSDTYYWTNNEVHQGITWLLLAFAAGSTPAFTSKRTLLSGTIFIILSALAIWTHPLVMLAALFLWFFYLIDNHQAVSRNEAVVYSIILLTLSFMKFYQGMHHGYDSGKIESVTQLSGNSLKTIFSAPQLHSFLRHCISNYWLLLLLFTTGVAALIKEKKYLLAAYSIVGSTGYLLLICITYRDLTDWLFYMESEYMPLSIICCAPFVYYALPKLNIKQGSILLVVILSVRLGYIQHASKTFTHRIAFLEQIMAAMKNQSITKAIVTQTDAANKDLIMNWGTPVESMILSQLDGNVPQRTFICADSGMLQHFNTNSKDTLLGCFEKVPVSRINARYFVIDTCTRYTTIPYGDLMHQAFSPH